MDFFPAGIMTHTINTKSPVCQMPIMWIPTRPSYWIEDRFAACLLAYPMGAVHCPPAPSRPMATSSF